MSRLMVVSKFTDDYYAVGYEGEKRSFVPTLELVEILLKKEGMALKLTSENPRYRILNKSLREYMSE